MSLPLWSANGLETRWHQSSDGQKAFEYRQDVEAILDENKARQNHSEGWSPERLFKHVAHIPTVVLYAWMKQDGVNFFSLKGEEQDAWLKRKINDPDWKFVQASKPGPAYLRPSKGRTFTAAQAAIR